MLNATAASAGQVLSPGVGQLAQVAVLSATSSLDNLTVGLSIGVHQQPLSVRLNLLVAACNAAGSWLSALVGLALGRHAPEIAGAAAAAIFAWLGAGEFLSLARGEEDSPLSSLAMEETGSSARRLAAALTLSNLAGGVAGGLAGANPLAMCVGGLVASFIMMGLGHRLGYFGAEMSRGGGKRKERAWDPRLFAGTAFFLLALSQLVSLLPDNAPSAGFLAARGAA